MKRRAAMKRMATMKRAVISFMVFNSALLLFAMLAHGWSGVSLAGIVVDANGYPVAGAKVIAQRQAADGQSADVTVETSDVNGNFRFKGLQIHTRYLLGVWHKQFKYETTIDVETAIGEEIVLPPFIVKYADNKRIIMDVKLTDMGR